MRRGVVFAIAGAKGGVGKTTTSINLCAVLARVGHDVVLVEMDLAMANVCDFLNLGVRLEHGRDPTLHEVLAGSASVAAATYEAPGGFDVVPSGTTLTGFASADINATGDVVGELREAYDVVILDTGAGLGIETVLPLSLADETILVSSPRVASVRDTKKTRNLVRHSDGTVAGVVFVKSRSGRSPGVDRIAEFLSVDLLGHIPEDGAVPSAQDAGKPVVVATRDSGAAKAYGALGSRIHERVGTIKGTLATGEREHDDAETDRESADEALETGAKNDADGFAFVGDSTDEADVPAEDSGRVDASDATMSAGGRGSADRQEPTASSRSAETNGSRRGMDDQTPSARMGEHETSHTDGQDGVSAGRREASPRTAPRQASERVDAAEAETQVGASDDEIAAQLASIEAEDEVESESTQPTSDESDRIGDERQGDGTRRADESESAGDDSWESKQSATKRFIDRAIGLIDRHHD